MDSHLLLSTLPSQRARSGTSKSCSDSQIDRFPRQTRLIIPGSERRLSVVLTIDEVFDSIKNLHDIQMAHEIAMNPNFRLQPHHPPEISSENRIKAISNEFFWEQLKDELNKSPPVYNHFITLLSNIKENFTHIVPENSQSDLDHIFEVLDEKHIQQQANDGPLDVRALSKLIIQWLEKFHCSDRDNDIRQLNEMNDVIQSFRRILEVMDLMGSDLVNCFLQAVRNEVITHSVEYEKRTFDEFLKAYPSIFAATEAWLLRNKCTDPNKSFSKSVSIINAYMEFLDWNPKHEYPEVMSVDHERMQGLAAKAFRLCCIATTIRIICIVPIIQQHADIRSSIIKQISILFANISTNEELAKSIENIWSQVKSLIASKLEKNKQTLTGELECALKHEILTLPHEETKVWKLMWTELIDYIRFVKTNQIWPSIPSGYIDLSDEIKTLAITFKRLTAYNYLVFGDHYETLLDKAAESTTENESDFDSESEATTSIQ